MDERIREFVLRGLRGDLRKRRGRKRTTQQVLKKLYAESLYDHFYPRIKARYERERGRGRTHDRGEYAASELAYVMTAKHVGLTWEGVRNLISSRKNPKISQ